MMQPNVAGPMCLPSHLVDQLSLTLELIKLGAEAMSKGKGEPSAGQKEREVQKAQ